MDPFERFEEFLDVVVCLGVLYFLSQSFLFLLYFFLLVPLAFVFEEEDEEEDEDGEDGESLFMPEAQ